MTRDEFHKAVDEAAESIARRRNLKPFLLSQGFKDVWDASDEEMRRKLETDLRNKMMKVSRQASSRSMRKKWSDMLRPS